MLALGMSAGLLMGHSNTAQANASTRMEVPKKGPGEDEPKKKAGNNTLSSSLNNPTVKIFPDVIKREMHVVAKENDGREIDFFVFDLQGQLARQFRMKAREHARISGLARGKYIYRVFAGDVEKASGELEIR